MANNNNLISKVKGVVTDIYTYWDKPSLGNQMSWKEIFAFSGGGIGVYFIIAIYSNILVQSVNNIILGNCLGFSPSEIYFVFVFSVFAGIPLTALRSSLIDNAQSKKGRFRPFLIKMGIPTTILSIAYVWIPYPTLMENGHRTLALIIVIVFNILFQFFYNFYKDAYESLVYVLSSNTYERTKVSAIKSVVYSLAPSILNAITPLFASIITDGNMDDIRLYKYLYPPLAVFGFMLSLVTYGNVREKIIQAKTHIPQMKLLDSLRMVLKNKYIWIISLAGWIGFLEGSIGQILYWLYEYGDACSPGLYALITTLYGNSAFWGMLLAPVAIKRFGKKKVIIATNLFNILLLAIMYPFVNSIWLVLVCMFLNGVVTAFTHILDPSIQGDIRDYQHYISGERIDGAFAFVIYFGTIIGTVTNSVMPMIYKSIGIFEGNGYANPYHILDIANGETLGGEPLLYHALHILLLYSVLGATLNVIPYFFYNLTENKHRAVVKVLKIRALFEEYGLKVHKDRDLVDVIDLIEITRENLGKEPVPVDKAKLKAAKKAKDYAAVEKIKEEIKAAEELNAIIEDADFVMKEVNKYDTVLGQKKLAFANEIYSQGYAGLATYDKAAHAAAKALPKTNADEKEYRKFICEIYSYKKRSAKLIAKYYPGGISAFDMTELVSLYDKVNEIEEKTAELYALHDEIVKTDKAQAKQINLDIKALKEEKKTYNKSIEVVNKKYVIHNRVVKPFVDCEKIITQEKNYRSYEEIKTQYDEAKLRAEEAERLAKEEEEKRLAELAAHDEQAKKEKELAKAAKKKH